MEILLGGFGAVVVGTYLWALRNARQSRRFAAIAVIRQRVAAHTGSPG